MAYGSSKLQISYTCSIRIRAHFGAKVKLFRFVTPVSSIGRFKNARKDCSKRHARVEPKLSLSIRAFTLGTKPGLTFYAVFY